MNYQGFYLPPRSISFAFDGYLAEMMRVQIDVLFIDGVKKQLTLVIIAS
jgi:hypothetical protein